MILVAISAWNIERWIINKFGGIRLVFKTSLNDHDSFSKYAGYCEFFVIMFVSIATALRLLFFSDQIGDDRNLKVLTIAMISTAFVDLVYFTHIITYKHIGLVDNMSAEDFRKNYRSETGLNESKCNEKADEFWEKYQRNICMEKFQVWTGKVLAAINLGLIVCVITQVVHSAVKNRSKGGSLISATEAVYFGLAFSLAYFCYNFGNIYLSSLKAKWHFSKEKFEKSMIKVDRRKSMVGIVLEGDMSREIEMRPDIYQLAFTLCLKQDKLIKFTKEDEDGEKPILMPTYHQVLDVFVATLLCASSVVFCSVFVSIELINKNAAESE